MNKLIHWTLGSFFRTIGRIFAYVVIGFLIALLLSHSSIKKIKISDIFTDIFFMKVDAATFTQEVKQNGTYYLFLDPTTDFTITGDYATKLITYSNDIQTASLVLSSDSINNIKNHEYVQFNYMIGNGGGTTSYDSSTGTSHVCKQWVCQTSSSNQQTCVCQSYNEVDFTLYDMEYTDSSNANQLNISANIDYNGWFAPCTIQENNIICPTYRQNYYKLIIRYLSNQDNGGNYKIVIPRSVAVLDSVNTAEAIINNQNQNNQAIINNQNQNNQAIINNQNQTTQEIINNQNQQTQAINNTITDESSPSNLSSISNDSLVGYLPPGPVDSLLNLPLVLLSSLQNALSSSCSPVTLTLPFVNSDIVLPCMSTLYESMGVGSFVNWAGIVASAFILFSYLLRFYKWVDNTLTFRENNWLDNWGGE